MKPLAQGKSIATQGHTLWLSLQYDRLPRFCFHCGIIKHPQSGCPVPPKTTLHGGSSKGQYGPRILGSLTSSFPVLNKPRPPQLGVITRKNVTKGDSGDSLLENPTTFSNKIQKDSYAVTSTTFPPQEAGGMTKHRTSQGQVWIN